MYFMLSFIKHTQAHWIISTELFSWRTECYYIHFWFSVKKGHCCYRVTDPFWQLSAGRYSKDREKYGKESTLTPRSYFLYFYELIKQIANVVLMNKLYGNTFLLDEDVTFLSHLFILLSKCLKHIWKLMFASP